MTDDARPVRVPATIRRRTPAAPIVVALLLAAALTGCEAAGFLAAASRPKVPAQHTLDPVDTLILVEDAELQLGDPSLANLMANAIADDLREQRALFGAAIVGQAELEALKADFGGRFERMAIDEIGQRLGAEQVVYVEVLAASVERAPGVLQPKGLAGVKVIDAVARERVFPAVEGVDAAQGSVRGRVVAARLSIDLADTEDRGLVAEVNQSLALALAHEAGKLFYEHRNDTSGNRLPD